jgi:hypothetical protein
LEPTIDVHIENAVSLQKLFSGVQSPGMPNDASCVGFFYGRVLEKLIERHAPAVMLSSAKTALATASTVPLRADMLDDLVFNFVLPHLCTALEGLNNNAK